VSFRKLLLFLFIILILLPATSRAGIVIPADSSSVTIRVPDKQQIAGYKSQDDFNYSRNNGQPSLIQILPDWLRNAITRLIKTIYNAGSAELFLVILLAAAIVAVILKVNDINPIALFRRKKRNLQPLFEIGSENIGEMDFPLLIESAVKQNNFRLAIRYHYLQSLNLLAGIGKIELREGKTNREYVQEISNLEMQNFFAKLVYGFEFVWYGEFLLNEKQYGKLSSAFGEFKKSLQV
jgi:hypothetical protein